MKANIIIVLDNGNVVEQYIIKNTSTAEAQFDLICNSLLKDDLEYVVNSIDYGENLLQVNRYLLDFGKEIIWLEGVKVNKF